MLKLEHCDVRCSRRDSQAYKAEYKATLAACVWALGRAIDLINHLGKRAVTGYEQQKTVFQNGRPTDSHSGLLVVCMRLNSVITRFLPLHTSCAHANIPRGTCFAPCCVDLSLQTDHFPKTGIFPDNNYLVALVPRSCDMRVNLVSFQCFISC